MDAGQGLFAGLHFDKRRFGEEMELFIKKLGGPSGMTSERHSALPVEGPLLTKQQASDVGQAIKNASKKKKRKSAAEQEDEVAGIDILRKGGIQKRTQKKAKKTEPSSKEEEAIALLRKQYRIRVSGQGAPAPLKDFEELATRFKCPKYLLQNLATAGYKEPTPIQRQTIPTLLQGRELFACAPTGSGKTIAFLLPILMILKAPSREGIRAVILSPTRELARQLHREVKKLTEGKKFRSRIMTKATAASVKSTVCDILISTPLRLNHMLEGKEVDLSKVQHLVLDESDKLFEMGFVEQIDGVLAACTHPTLQRSLFSATLPETVEELARSVMHDPVRVVVGERNSAAETVRQKLLFVGSEEGKLLAIRHMFKEGLRPPVLVFVQSKERAKELYKELAYDGMNVDVIHADKPKAQRDKVVDSFRAGKTWVLIATDVMGRGMDFKGVNHVINYDFPQSTAAYIHRIGRSGRAGRQGEATTFYTEEDKPMLRAIANVVSASGSEVPAWMLSLPKERRRNRKGYSAPFRASISTAPKVDSSPRKRKPKRQGVEASKKRSE